MAKKNYYPLVTVANKKKCLLLTQQMYVNYEKKKLYYTSGFNAENFMKARICFNFYMKYIGKYFSVEIHVPLNYNCI